MRIKVKDNKNDTLRFSLEAEVSRDEFKDAHDLSLDFLSHQQQFSQDIPQDLVNRFTHETLAYLALEEKFNRQAYPIEISSKEKEDFILLEVMGILKPSFSLKSYDLPEIKKSELYSIDSTVDSQLKEIALKNAHYICIDPEPLAEDGACDAAVILYENKIKIDGLTNEARRYLLAQGVMPEEFDKNIVGMRAGDRKSFSFTVSSFDNLGYPEEKEASCEVYIEHVYKVDIPKLNDSWVNEHYPMYESLNALKEQLLTNITSQSKQVLDSQKYSKAIAELSLKLVESIPDEIFEMAMQDQIAYIQKSLQEQHKTLEEYMESLGGEEHFNSELLLQTKNNLSAGFALDAIFEHENLKISDDDMIKSAYTLAESEAKKTIEFYKQSGRKKLLEEHAKRGVAAKWLLDNIKIVE